MIVANDDVVSFVSKELGVSFSPPMTCMGIERNGKIIGGVVFNIFEGADVHVSVAGKGFSKGFLAEVGHYCFDILKCERMTAITESKKIVVLGERLGGVLEGCMRNHFGWGRDGFVVGILKSEYKY